MVFGGPAFASTAQFRLVDAKEACERAAVALVQFARAALADELLEIAGIAPEQRRQSGQADALGIDQLHQPDTGIGGNHEIPILEGFFLDK